eukprot:m.114924 g.114924  ORF g.114924 m.114924 type:complete len:86 (+) comp37524_c0_seq1:73-330(+)
MALSERIAEACLDRYKALPIKGKPHASAEWTVLAGIVREVDWKCKVVSLGTGTKCIGANKMSKTGNVDDCWLRPSKTTRVNDPRM